MPNPYRGQVGFRCADRSYTLSFSVGALCALEADLNKPLADIVATMSADCPLHVLRSLLWAALRDHHDDVDLNAAGDLAATAGAPVVLAAVSKALDAASPSPTKPTRQAGEKAEQRFIDPLPLLTTWVACEQDAGLFWKLTFKEVAVVIEGARARLQREHNDRAWHAWHVAALGRAKRLPKLKSLLHDSGRPKKPQTIEEQIAIAKIWTASINRRTRH